MFLKISPIQAIKLYKNSRIIVFLQNQVILLVNLIIDINYQITNEGQCVLCDIYIHTMYGEMTHAAVKFNSIGRKCGFFSILFLIL